jgi:predicted naringenin-chalcone synthase
MGPLRTTVAPDSEGDMAWTIGDRGFDIVLSTYVPRILEANVAGIVDALLADTGGVREDIRHWAVHPGGRAILDKVESGLGLNDDSLASSRTVLSRYGNMSSATIWFVLEEMLSGDRVRSGDSVCAMAFGPGLTVECAVFDVA